MVLPIAVLVPIASIRQGIVRPLLSAFQETVRPTIQVVILLAHDRAVFHHKTDALDGGDVVEDRRGEPVVVILSVQDYLASVQNAPDWLREAWTGAKKRGLEKLTMDEIDAEIDAYRREKRVAAK